MLPAPLNARSEALRSAIFRGDEADLASILGSPAGAGEPALDLALGLGPDGAPPIVLAARVGRIDCLRLLAERGPILARDSDGDHALHAAILANQPEATAFLAPFFDLQERHEQRSGLTPMGLAISSGRGGCVRALLRSGSPLDGFVLGTVGPLELAIAMDGHARRNAEFLDVLIEAFLDKEGPGWFKGPSLHRERTALHCAAISDNEVAVQRLLPLSDPMALDRNDRTPMELAIEFGRPHSALALASSTDWSTHSRNFLGKGRSLAALLVSAPRSVQLIADRLALSMDDASAWEVFLGLGPALMPQAAARFERQALAGAAGLDASAGQELSREAPRRL